MNFSATTTNVKGKALNILSMSMIQMGLWNTVFYCISDNVGLGPQNFTQ